MRKGKWAFIGSVIHSNTVTHLQVITALNASTWMPAKSCLLERANKKTGRIGGTAGRSRDVSATALFFYSGVLEWKTFMQRRAKCISNLLSFAQLSWKKYKWMGAEGENSTQKVNLDPFARCSVQLLVGRQMAKFTDFFFSPWYTSTVLLF